jgi:hypothetical protein
MVNQSLKENGSHYIADCIKNFEKLKGLADRAVAQLEDYQIHFVIDNESNSVAVIMKHMSGNMISRWTDFLNSDGEKAERNRDEEFIDRNSSKIEVIEYWEKGWNTVFDTLKRLNEDDLMKTVYIRAEPHTVIEAINRQLTHYSYHVGQIVFLSKHIKGKFWQTLSIPKGKSDDFNRSKFGK